jgi:hypothetical protein
VGMDLKDMDRNSEEMTPEERNRFEYLCRVAQILRMPPDELKKCDDIMAICWSLPPNDEISPKPWDRSSPYIPLALRK